MPKRTTARRVFGRKRGPSPPCRSRAGWVIANPVLRRTRGSSYADDSRGLAPASRRSARALRVGGLPVRPGCARRYGRPPNSHAAAYRNADSCPYPRADRNAGANPHGDAYCNCDANFRARAAANGNARRHAYAYSGPRANGNARPNPNAHSRACADGYSYAYSGACARRRGSLRAAGRVRRLASVRSRSGSDGRSLADGLRTYAHSDAACDDSVRSTAPAALHSRRNARRLYAYAHSDAARDDSVRSIAPAALHSRRNARISYAHAHAAHAYDDSVRPADPASLRPRRDGYAHAHAYADSGACAACGLRPPGPTF